MVSHRSLIIPNESIEQEPGREILVPPESH